MNCCNEQNRQLTPMFGKAQALGELKTIHVWHLHINNRNGKGLQFDACQGLFARPQRHGRHFE
jgi:hypothetical protein